MVMRRKTQWYTTRLVDFSLIAGAQDALILFDQLSAVGDIVKGCTVTRMLVDLWMKPASVAQVNTALWGITTVNSDARAAGALPEADDLAERAGWLVRGELYSIANALTRSEFAHTQMDLRSQRVLRNDEEELILIIDNAGSFTMVWHAFVRVLIKLPL